MSYKTTKDQLVTILTTLTGSGQPLKTVSGWSDPSSEEYPFAYVRISDGGSEERVDSCRNNLHMQFKIVVKIRSKNTLANEDERLTLLDSVLDKLRETAYVDTLGGTVQRFDVLDISPIDIQDADQPELGFELITQSSLLKTITS